MLLRRAGAVVVAAASVAVALWLSARDVSAHVAVGEKRAHSAAEEALAETRGRLLAEALGQASTAASLAPVTSMIGEGANDATFADAMLNEAYFAPFRGAGAATVLAIGDRLVASTGPLSPSAPAALQPLVQSAAGTGRAGGFLAAPVRVVGAARLAAETPNGLPVVMVHLRELDAAALGRVVGHSKDSAALVTAAGVIVVGPDADRLRASVSSPAAPCCAGAELASGATLVVFHDPADVLASAEEEGRRSRPLYLGIAFVLALVALALGFWPLGVARDKLLRDTAVELQRSREELARVSRVLTASGSSPTPAAPAAPPEAGLAATHQSTTGSRYEVVDLLGEGGMARVYLAVAKGAEGFKRTFVVKRLRPELSGDVEAVNQFIDEARLGASLVHSNIIPVFDFGRDSEGYFLAQEYILGRNVEAIVEASKQKLGRALEPAVVLTLAQEALKALSYAHAKTDDEGKALSLVHRDVSPNNLMVSARGELKLLDFGIVKGEHRLTRTQTGMVKGNLFYMSPEQAKALPLDGRSDLFSLGLVLFFAATGETLFSGNTSYELLIRTAAGPTADDLTRIRALGAALAPLIERALALERANRFASADEFSAAVAAAGVAAPGATLRQLMDALFRDDFVAEQARFSQKST